MKFDSVQITKMSNGYLVSFIMKGNQFTGQPLKQEDKVFLSFGDVLKELNPTVVGINSKVVNLDGSAHKTDSTSDLK